MISQLELKMKGIRYCLTLVCMYVLCIIEGRNGSETHERVKGECTDSYTVIRQIKLMHCAHLGTIALDRTVSEHPASQ